MRYLVSGDFIKISETAGTIQNVGNVYSVEVSDKAAPDSGILLYPLNKISFSDKTLYIRCVEADGQAEVRVVSFTVDSDSGTSSGGSSMAGDTSDALVAYLPFNNSPTADACGNVWTTAGNPTIVDGALYLDGTSYLSCSSIASLSSSQTWTIDFWATLEADDWFHYFFGMDNIGGLYDYTGHNTWYVKSNVVTSTDLSLNTRHHIAVCCDGNGIRLFVDGVKTYEKTDTTWEFTSPVYIGAGTNGGFPMKGKIEKFRVFNQIIWDTDFTPPTAGDYV